MNKGWSSVCGLWITATGLPFDHDGFYPSDYSGAVSLYPVSVGSGPFDWGAGCSWWVRKSGLARVPMNQAFSLRCTAPTIGQGSTIRVQINSNDFGFFWN